MSFLLPAYLVGLAALALPWLLHRFSHVQPETREFPTTRFLDAVRPPQSRRRKLRHRVLFALRWLALIALCLLFAEPWIARVSDAGATRRLHVLAIDRSFSMRADGRFERAVERARDRLRALPEGAPVSLLAVGDGVVTLVDGAADGSGDGGGGDGGDDAGGNGAREGRAAGEDGGRGAALAALDALEPGFGRADDGLLMRRLDTIASNSALPVDAVFVTDAQASAMPTRLNELFAPRLASLEIVSTSAAGAEPSPPDADPATVNARLDATVATLDGVTGRVALRLRADAATERELRVSHDGETLASERVSLPAGEVVDLTIEPLTLPPVERPVLDVAFGAADVLPDDDAQRVAVRTAEPLPVVLAALGTRVPDAARVFLQTAFETDREASVEVLDTGALELPDDARNAAVLVEADDDEALATVARQIARGTNVLLVVLPAGGADAAGVGADGFGGGGLGGVPAADGVGATSTATDVDGATVGTLDDAHPIGLGEIDWNGVRFYGAGAWRPSDDDVVLLETSAARPVLYERTASGSGSGSGSGSASASASASASDAASRSAGGRLLVLDDPLDGAAGNLPFEPAFVELLQRVLAWFDASASIPERALVGESVALPANVQVLDPDGRGLLSLGQTGSARTLAFDRPGLHTVVDSRGEHMLQVITDPRESALAPLPPADIEAWERRHDDATDATDGADPTDAAPADARPDAAIAAAAAREPPALASDDRRLLWRYLLPLLAALLILETLLANRRLDVRRDGS